MFRQLPTRRVAWPRSCRLRMPTCWSRPRWCMTWATLPRCIGSAFMAVDGARFLRGQGQERLARLVRTPQVDHHQVAAIIRATVGLCADPAELLAQQARGLRLVPEPGDAA
jgi:hypothetical protein